MTTESFDVFDTVLTRAWAEPHDLFVALGSRLTALELSTLAPEEFATVRRAAEAKARQRHSSREIVLDEIYHELSREMRWDRADLTAARGLELTLEGEMVQLVPGACAMVREARARAGRVLFLSDTYFPESVLRGWLERAGLFTAGDRLFASGECRAGKGTGALFQFVRKELGLEFTPWHHAGDNPVSDFDAPRALGIKAELLDRARLHRHERALRGHGDFAPPWRSQLAGAARLARLDAADRDVPGDRAVLWGVGATVTAPLFWAFTEWCLAEAERRQLTDLYFLSRGGQIFLRIAELIQAARPRPLRLHYLLTSRLAYAGSADVDNDLYLRSLAAAPLRFHSVRQALANVGLDPQDTGDIPGIPRTEWDRNLTPRERAAVAKFLLADAHIDEIRAALRGRAGRARHYLQQCGLNPGIRAGVVDTGWMGTIQKNIEFLIATDKGPTPLTGFYLGLSSVREFACAGEMLAYTNTYARLPLRRETTHLILLEIMARATHGPLLRFELSEGLIKPVSGPVAPATITEVAFFQDAVLAFVQRILRAPAMHDLPRDSLARTVIETYRDFFHHPSRREVLVFGRIPHADQMLESRYTVLCPDMTTTDVITAMVDFHRRPPGWWHAGQATLGNKTLIRGYLLLKRARWLLRRIVARTLD
jgi:FMN phosphatase YigB (HAD superfamily)